MYDNVTIILQGIIIPEVDIIHTISEYSKIAHIILSVYSDLGNNEYITKIINTFPNVRIVYNSYEEYKAELISQNKLTNNSYLDNCYYQLKCTKKAIDEVNTAYVVKTRVDHFYSGLADGDMIRWCIDQNKILSSSIYVRSYYYQKYHLSDHLFIGWRCHINHVFTLALLFYNPGCPEVNIWKPFILDIAHKEGVKIDELDALEYSKYMASKFYVYNINRNLNYKVKIGGGVYDRVHDNDKTREDSTDYFLHGCDFP